MLEKEFALFLLFNSTPFNGTKYVFGEIVAVNQIDSQDGNALTAPAEPLSVPVNGDLLCMDASATTIVPATHIVLMSNDDNANSSLASAVVALAQTPATFAVTIVANDGVVVTEGDTIPANGNYSSITLPVLKKDGYTFMGWSDGTIIIPNSNTANSRLRKVELIMKKYTQPTVEITAFDFEDIMNTSSPTGKTYSQAVADGWTKPTEAVEVTVEW